MQVQSECICGGKYWPNQRWVHEKCAVVNSPVAVVVNSRTKDRHKDKEARRVYLREYMRRKRSKA